MKKFVFFPAIALLCLACNNSNNSERNTPVTEETAADWELTTKVKAAIMSDSSISTSARFVSVNTNNGVVVLSGTVPSKEDSHRIVKIVKDIDGVVKVKNHMTISKNS